MTGKKLTTTQLEFIFEKKDTMKQKDIAAFLKITPAAVCKVLKPKAKIIVMECFFNIDKEAKKYY